MKIAIAKTLLTLASLTAAAPTPPSPDLGPRQIGTPNCKQECGASLALITCPTGQIPVLDGIGTVGGISSGKVCVLCCGSGTG